MTPRRGKRKLNASAWFTKDTAKTDDLAYLDMRFLARRKAHYWEVKVSVSPGTPWLRSYAETFDDAVKIAREIDWGFEIPDWEGHPKPAVGVEQDAGKISLVNGRPQIVANSAATLRLEGLRSGAGVNALLAAWARGEVSDEDLSEAERRILAGEPLDGLVARVAPASAPRAA